MTALILLGSWIVALIFFWWITSKWDTYPVWVR